MVIIPGGNLNPRIVSKKTNTITGKIITTIKPIDDDENRSAKKLTAKAKAKSKAKSMKKFKNDKIRFTYFNVNY